MVSIQLLKRKCTNINIDSCINLEKLGYAPVLAFVGIVVAILLTLMSRAQAPGGVLLASWLAAVLVVYAGRFLLAQANFRSPTRGSRAWLTRFRAAAALQGALWGLSAFILFPGQRPLDDIAYLFAISGLTAGAAPRLGIHLTSMLGVGPPPAGPPAKRRGGSGRARHPMPRR